MRGNGRNHTQQAARHLPRVAGLAISKPPGAAVLRRARYVDRLFAPRNGLRLPCHAAALASVGSAKTAAKGPKSATGQYAMVLGDVGIEPTAAGHRKGSALAPLSAARCLAPQTLSGRTPTPTTGGRSGRDARGGIGRREDAFCSLRQSKRRGVPSTCPESRARGDVMANTPLTRAEFLKILAAGSAGVLFLGGAEEALAGITGTNDALDQAALDGDARAAHTAGTVLAVAKGTNASGNVQRAIAAVGGMRKFVHSGDTVVIKPNHLRRARAAVCGHHEPAGGRHAGAPGEGRRRRQGACDGQPHRQRSDRCLQRQRDRRRCERGRRLDAVHEQLGLQEVPAGRLSGQLPALRRHRERQRAHQRSDRETARIHRASRSRART